MTSQQRYPLASYADEHAASPVFAFEAVPNFSPLDINIALLNQIGWNQALDRMRFHPQRQSHTTSTHPLAEAIQSITPHLLIRHLDRDEDRFVSVQIAISGNVTVLSNDSEYARLFFQGLFLECPPAFHSIHDVEVRESWHSDPTLRAMFLGMLMGAQGWDPSHSIPENISQSLDEAKKSLDIANYRSCVVMCRRTLEAVLKFGYERLLKRKPVNSKGQGLMLNDLIQAFRASKPAIVPAHLLHIADAIRLLGNIPGAHAAEIPDYHFSRSDAEFALYSASHFLDQYFSKIDMEVTQYYTVTADLNAAADAQAEPPTGE